MVCLLPEGHVSIRYCTSIRMSTIHGTIYQSLEVVLWYTSYRSPFKVIPNGMYGVGQSLKVHVELPCMA